MIDDKTIDTVLALCRFRLSDSEKTRFKKEIGDILSYMEILEGVDTAAVDIDLGKAVNPDSFRRDESAGGLEAEKLETLTPYFEHGYFKVPQIIEEMDENKRGKT
jgi:aspartyl-tRNA(Asn)/glutamyl-tRNA(Gln) amidotransferase subunit C